MAQSLNYDLDAIGGGGGFGGFGGANNPLYWLIILGFLKGDNGLFGGNGNQAGAGFVAGETQSKLDCLAQQHTTLMQQIAKNDTDQNFVTLGTAIDSLAGIQRDATAAITAQNNDLSRQLADCCCDLKTGQQAIQTAIAMQTNELSVQATANTQRLADLINANTVEAKNDRIRELEQNAQTATIAAVVRDTCGGHSASVPNIDINVLARALQGQAQAS